MKNRKSITTIAASLAALTALTLPLAANAQSSAQSGSTAGAASQAAVIVNSPLTAPVSAAGGTGIGSASIQGGMQNVGVSAGGGQSASSLTLGQTFVTNGSEIPLQAAAIPGFSVGSPTLFLSNGATNPVQLTSAQFARWARRICRQVSDRTYHGSSEVVTGSSGDTTIRVTYYPDFNKKRFATDLTEPRVSWDMPDTKTPVVCVAFITGQGKGGDVDIGTVDTDVERWALGLRGFGQLWILSPESTIGGGLGVETDGKGLGLGGSGTGIAGAVTSALGVSGGFSKGTTTPSTKIGGGYVIVAVPQAHGASADMSLGAFDTYHARLMGAPSNPTGVTAKEASAAKK